jgi:predicted kinase
MTASDDPSLELAILVGLPAAGKTSFYRARLAPTHAHVSKDLIRSSPKDRRQREQIDERLRAGRSVAVDNTNPRASDRAPLVALGRERGARVVAYYFPTTPKASLERNRTREGKAKVPAVAVFRAAKLLEPPSLAEGFDALFTVELVPPTDFTVSPWAGATLEEQGGPPGATRPA